MKKLKEEYQPGGSKRQEILDKAVQYILNPRFGTQNAKHAFLLEEVGLSESCLLYTSPSPRDRQKSRMPSSA